MPQTQQAQEWQTERGKTKFPDSHEVQTLLKNAKRTCQCVREEPHLQTAIIVLEVDASEHAGVTMPSSHSDHMLP